jgi:multidrug efflux pump subunit AcrB
MVADTLALASGGQSVSAVNTQNQQLNILVRNPPPFAMEQVKAVRVNEPETGGQRRRH